MQADVGAVV